MRTKTELDQNSLAPPRDTLLHKLDVMSQLKVCRSTVDAAMREGTLPFVKIGRAVRFRAADVESFIFAHRTGPTKTPASRRQK